MEKEILIQQLCEAEHEKRKFNKGNFQREDNSAGKVLRILANADSILHPSDLCQIMGVSTPRITTILNGMEDDGLIERQIARDDKRRFAVILTEKGKDLIKERKQRSEERTRRLVEKIGIDDAEALLRIMRAEIELMEENS